MLKNCTRAANHSLVFPASGLAQLRRVLLADAPLESARFLLARPVLTPGGAWRLIVYDVIAPRAEEYDIQSEHALRLQPSVVARVVQRARADGASIVLAHSHPLDEEVRPSAADIAGEKLLLPLFRRRVPHAPHGRLILGTAGIHARLFHTDGGESAVETVEAGANITFCGTNRSETKAFANAPRDQQYDRQVRAFGDSGQRVLTSLRAAIVGLGGTGSVVAQQLAHLGVGAFLLIDQDTIERTNLNRVVGARRADIGRTKVDVARDMILAISPEAAVESIHDDVCNQSIARRLLDADVFMVCTDSQGSRAVLSQLAYQYALPGVDVGVAIHVSEKRVSHIAGRVQLLAPGLPCLTCCDILDAEQIRRDLLTDEARSRDSYIVGASVQQPAVVSINCAASSLAVTMLLSAITGMPYATRNQRLRLELGVVSRVEIERRPRCPICSEDGALVRGDSWPMPGRNA